MAREKRFAQFSARDQPALNREQQRIIAWLSKTRFKRQLLGGVNERDVWKKLEELNGLFDRALIAERARYDTLLAQERMRADGCAKADAVHPGKEREDLWQGKRKAPPT